VESWLTIQIVFFIFFKKVLRLIKILYKATAVKFIILAIII